MSDGSGEAPVEVTIREITELVRQFDESDWGSLELDIHGIHLVLGKDGAPSLVAAAPPSPAPALTPVVAPAEVPPDATPAAATPAAVTPAPAAPVASGTVVEVRSPVVGAFWAAPSPGEPPFVQVGDTVAAGQQLAIVEVMKLMSNVSAPTAGVVVEIAANNAEMVEFDQLLFRIDSGAGDA